MSDQPIESRLDRLEIVVEKLAEEFRRYQEEAREDTREFKAAVRGAFTVTQQQIEENGRAIAELTRQWQAYLSTIHPKQ